MSRTPWNDRQRLRVDLDRDAAGRRHLGSRGRQTEPGDVGAGVNAVDPSRWTSAAVLFKRASSGDRAVDQLRRRAAELDRRADDAGAERLGEDQHVAGLRAGVGEMRSGSTAPVTA